MATPPVTRTRPISLSHTLNPGQEEYRLDVTTDYVEHFLPEYVGLRLPGADYVMSEVVLSSHVGTHVEVPRHYFKDGQDLVDMPLERFVGQASLVRCMHRQPGEPITGADLDERGPHVLEGDIVFIRTDSGFYGTPRSHDRPYLARTAVDWLLERKIACLGVDCSGIELRGVPEQPNHMALFAEGIPIIEHLAGLDQLPDRFYVVAAPWRVRGLEACPVSVVAFVEDEA
jgi:arylformamidase